MNFWTVLGQHFPDQVSEKHPYPTFARVHRSTSFTKRISTSNRRSAPSWLGRSLMIPRVVPYGRRDLLNSLSNPWRQRIAEDKACDFRPVHPDGNLLLSRNETDLCFDGPRDRL